MNLGEWLFLLPFVVFLGLFVARLINTLLYRVKKEEGKTQIKGFMDNRTLWGVTILQLFFYGVSFAMAMTQAGDTSVSVAVMVLNFILGVSVLLILVDVLIGVSNASAIVMPKSGPSFQSRLKRL